jgi:pimeloyl-ACP methyl ester carboxylesterase
VGSALYRQLSTVANDLVGRLIPECGHIIPLDHPDALLAEVVPFLR